MVAFPIVSNLFLFLIRRIVVVSLRWSGLSLAMEKPREETIAQNGTYIPYVDGLRGLAILGVVLVHTSQYAGNNAIGSFSSHTIESFVNAGARGVQLFFILSAFTLFVSSQANYLIGHLSARAFYIRRFFRILPLWWGAAIIYALAGGASFRQTAPTLLMYFGFMRHDPAYEVIQFGWSIFVEETFYLFLPVVFLTVTKWRRAVYFLLALIGLRFLWVLNAAEAGAPTGNNFISLFPLAHWYCFGLGIVLFHLLRDRRVLAAVEDRGNCHVLDISALFLVVCWLRLDLVYPALSLVAVFVAAASPHTIIGRLCRVTLLRRYGAFCYSIYLFHGLILRAAHRVTPAYYELLGIAGGSVEIKFLALAAVILPTCYVVGHVSFVYIEKPCVLLGRKLALKVGPAQSPLALR